MRKSTIVGAVLCAACALVAGARADSPPPSPGPAPAPGPGSTSVAALQAQVAALQTRVTALETHVQKSRSACTQFDLDLRAQAPGFKCLTKRGTYFERVSKNGFGEAWKAPDGTIWGDLSLGQLSFDDAKKACKDVQGRLPSPQDLQQVYKSGFPEVDPAPNPLFVAYWTSLTATGLVYVGPLPGKMVQEVGDVEAYMNSDPAALVALANSGPNALFDSGAWAQTTPHYNALTNRSTSMVQNTRCIAK